MYEIPVEEIPVNNVTRLLHSGGGGVAGALELGASAAIAAKELGIGGISKGANVDEGATTLGIEGGGVGSSTPGDVGIGDGRTFSKVGIGINSEGVPLIFSLILKFAMTVRVPGVASAISLVRYV